MATGKPPPTKLNFQLEGSNDALKLGVRYKPNLRIEFRLGKQPGIALQGYLKDGAGNNIFVQTLADSSGFLPSADYRTAIEAGEFNAITAVAADGTVSDTLSLPGPAVTAPPMQKKNPRLSVSPETDPCVIYAVPVIFDLTYTANDATGQPEETDVDFVIDNPVDIRNTSGGIWIPGVTRVTYRTNASGLLQIAILFRDIRLTQTVIRATHRAAKVTVTRALKYGCK